MMLCHAVHIGYADHMMRACQCRPMPIPRRTGPQKHGQGAASDTFPGLSPIADYVISGSRTGQVFPQLLLLQYHCILLVIQSCICKHFTVSSPPRYSAPDDDQSEQSHPLLKTQSSSDHSYPPIRSVDDHDSDDPDAPAVTYYYEPKYPATGDTQRVMGLLSTSKEAS